MEKFLEYLQEAERKIQLAEHMAYVTFPLIKEKKLLLKILSEIDVAVLNLINSILQYEYLYKRISLTKDARENLRIFIEKCAPRYSINNQEINSIKNLIELTEKHRNSPFEFMRNDKVIIMSENLRTEILTIEKIKEFVIMIKNILKKTKETMKRYY